MPKNSHIFVVEYPDGSTERCYIELDRVYAGDTLVSPKDLQGAVIRNASMWALSRLADLGFELEFSPDTVRWFTTTIRLTELDNLHVSEMAKVLNISRNAAMLQAIREKHEAVCGSLSHACASSEDV